jgi:pimeloyl-ACP methyl ester carboxylesterase
VLFLPGASGNTDFWTPVAKGLSLNGGRSVQLGWPGFGQTAPAPDVSSLDDLVRRVTQQIDRPTALVAQSMGGVVAIRAALACGAQVTHLVLAGLSGGVALSPFGARDWRPPRDEIRADDPSHLFAAFDEDLTPHLPDLRMPTLLLWGEHDPISPVGVGQWLATVLPNARLEVVPGGTHTFGQTHAAEVTPLIQRHLMSD